MQSEKKIYQVFVSSTFTDLETERLRVIRDMLMSDFYPLGMESFPASSDEQLAFCKRMIDRADYYVLIIGTRYGTETTDGLSYTELEYEYAKEREIPILVFASKDPESKPAKFLESKSKQEKYESFRKRAMTNKVAIEWTSAENLSTTVIASLHREIIEHPRYGLVRSDTTSNFPDIVRNLDILGSENEQLRKNKREYVKDYEKLLSDYNALKDSSERERNKLEKQIDKLEMTVLTVTEELKKLKGEITEIQKKRQQLDINVDLSGTYPKLINSCLMNQEFYYTVSLRLLFEAWGPYLCENDSIYRAKNDLENTITSLYKLPSPQLSMDSFNRIKMLLCACGVVSLSSKEYGRGKVECISLTNSGDKLLQELILESSHALRREV